MILFLEILAAIVFVASSGLIFDRFRQNRSLVLLTGALAITSTVFLAKQIFFDKPDASPPPKRLMGPADPQQPQLSLSPSPSPSQYERTSCGSIRDTQNGLEWYIGADRDVSWFDAFDWVNGLQACGGKWSMPTLNQLSTLYISADSVGTGRFEDGGARLAHIDPVFSGIGGGASVWASDVMPEHAATFDLNQDTTVRVSPDSGARGVRMFAVREF